MNISGWKEVPTSLGKVAYNLVGFQCLILKALLVVTLQPHDLYDFLQSLHFLGPGSLLPKNEKQHQTCEG